MGGIITLKGVALSKYGSVSKFSRNLGWSRNKASRILNKLQEPTLEEIVQLSECLGISEPDTFMDIFFENCPQSGQTDAVTPARKAHKKAVSRRAGGGTGQAGRFWTIICGIHITERRR